MSLTCSCSPVVESLDDAMGLNRPCSDREWAAREEAIREQQLVGGAWLAVAQVPDSSRTPVAGHPMVRCGEPERDGGFFDD